MATTVVKGKKGEKAASEKPADMATTDVEAVNEKAGQLLEQCSEVRLRINWFGMSAKVDAETATEMLKGTDADRKAVSISKRLMTSQHDASTALRAARRAIEEHVRGWTLPMMALRTTSEEDSEAARKDAGVRLIQKKHMAEFDERLQYLISVLQTAVQNLQKYLPEVKALDKDRLKKLYRESDYPEDVTKLVGVAVSYRPVGVDVDWKALCPKVYEREQILARKKFEAVVENAAVEFASTFVGYVRQVCEDLGNRVRLNPDDSVKMLNVLGPDGETKTDVSDAEVIEVRTHVNHGETVDDAHVCLRLRVKVAGNKRVEVWTANIEEQFYRQRLRPYETGERNRLHTSSVEKLKGQLETFINVGDVLGPYKVLVEDGVKTVRAMLTKASVTMDAGSIAEQLREGTYFRTEMKTALETVADQVERAVFTGVARRRTISKKLIGKV